MLFCFHILSKRTLVGRVFNQRLQIGSLCRTNKVFFIKVSFLKGANICHSFWSDYFIDLETIVLIMAACFSIKNDILVMFSGPFRRFSMLVWQNARADTVRRAMVCDVCFLFSKILYLY